MLQSGPARIPLGASYLCPATAPASEALGVDGSALGFVIQISGDALAQGNSGQAAGRMMKV